MGRKYASYHICSGNGSFDSKQVESIVQFIQGKNNTLEQATMAFSNPLSREMMDRFIRMQGPSVIIVMSNRFISVYDDSLSFLNINSEVKRISKTIIEPILYVSNFDDDLLLMGAVKQGKTIAKRHIGENLDDYGIRKGKSSINSLQSQSEFSSLISDDALFKSSNDIFTCETSLEHEFGITLKLTLDEIEKPASPFRKIRSYSSLNVYQRIETK
ncbi:MAG: hypothetical protein FWH28_02365 [Clostridiales bacterium]|nr:hypothetical protein [Clostridiales bacterium]